MLFPVDKLLFELEKAGNTVKDTHLVRAAKVTAVAEVDDIPHDLIERSTLVSKDLSMALAFGSKKELRLT